MGRSSICIKGVLVPRLMKVGHRWEKFFSHDESLTMLAIVPAGITAFFRPGRNHGISLWRVRGCQSGTSRLLAHVGLWARLAWWRGLGGLSAPGATWANVVRTLPTDAHRRTPSRRFPLRRDYFRARVRARAGVRVYRVGNIAAVCDGRHINPCSTRAGYRRSGRIHRDGIATVCDGESHNPNSFRLIPS